LDNRLNIELSALAHNERGQLIRHVERSVTGKIAPEKLDSLRGGPMQLVGHLELPPGHYTVRFVVRDNISGNLGSVTAPVNVQ
jgi:hypothetical protein